jgi:SRSO17 transposase
MVKPRPAQPTVKFIDEYCETYRDLFPEVRTFEYFKYLHLGMISDRKRKSLPAIAGVVGLEDAEGLDPFLTESPWSGEELKKRRLKLILNRVNGEKKIALSHRQFPGAHTPPSSVILLYYKLKCGMWVTKPAGNPFSRERLTCGE